MLTSISMLLLAAIAQFIATVKVTATHFLTSSPAPGTAAPVVIVKNGSYTGVYSSVFNQDFFLGIPYAQPPINNLRFRVPESLNSTWTIPKNAIEYPPFCVGYGVDDVDQVESEDCLYLEVIRPSTATSCSSFPVSVWIHGGGLYMGGSSDPRYNLSFIVQNSVEMNKPMIGISIQYRLSAWGFLGGKEALEGGATNLGYRDQRLALHWIQENIAAFGGDPSQVTIWGESAGGQSVGAQLLAYNGRDDNLFRAAIAQSGGPAVSFFPATIPLGFNSTAYQIYYDALVAKTSCAPTLSNGTSLSCLRSLPFAEINAALNVSSDRLGPFVPVIDNDFIVTYPSNQLYAGKFVRVPLLIGANTDEGTSFGTGYGPNGNGVNTDAEWLQVLNSTGISPTSDTASIISALYPNIQALGIPSLTTYPSIVTPGSPVASELGLQLRRTAAYFGDVVVIAPRRASSTAWSTYNVPSYSYRFDVTVNGIPNFIGATHFQEVAFVFNNTKGQGYAINPFPSLTEAESTSFQDLAVLMSRSWVAFITELDPNKNGIRGANIWPVYNTTTGGGEGSNIVFSVNETSYVEPDTFRGEGIAWISRNFRDVYGQ